MSGHKRSTLAFLAAAAVGMAAIPEMTERGLYTPPRKQPNLPFRPVRRIRPYHIPARDTVLMDWDYPKGKRAKRRARGRAKAEGPGSVGARGGENG